MNAEFGVDSGHKRFVDPTDRDPFHGAEFRRPGIPS